MDRALAALVALLAFALHVPNLPVARPPHEDAGVFLYAADLLRAGGLPYRDVWDHKTPLVYVLDAFGLLIAGGSELGVWALQAAGFAAAAAVGYRAMATGLGSLAALVATLAWLLAAPRLYLVDGAFTNFVQLYAPPLQWGALALLAHRSGRTALAAGALGGAAALLSPALAGIWLAGALLLARGRALRSLLGLAAGGLVIVALVLLLFARGAALPHLSDQALRYNAIYTAEATPAERAEAVGWGLRLTSRSGLAVLAGAGLVVALRRAARGRLATLHALAALAIPLDVALAGLSGRSYDHYFIAWLPSMAVLAAVAADSVFARVRAAASARGLPPSAAVAVVAIALVAAMSLRAVGVVARALVAEEDGASRIAARYLALATDPEDPVYIWGSHTESLFLAQRRAPTRYVYPYGPLFTVGYSTDAEVDELLADLRRTRPLIILDASGASPVTPPLDRASMLSYDTHDRLFKVPPSIVRLVDFIESDYVRDGALEHSGWPVYRRR